MDHLRHARFDLLVQRQPCLDDRQHPLDGLPRPVQKGHDLGLGLVEIALGFGQSLGVAVHDPVGQRLGVRIPQDVGQELVREAFQAAVAQHGRECACVGDVRPCHRHPGQGSEGRCRIAMEARVEFDA